jgi:hypothetical protein
MDEFKKSDLQAMLNNIPRIAENADLISAMTQLLNAKRIIKKPFTYATNFTNTQFTAGTTLTNNIAIQSDAPFLIQSQTYSADVAAAGQTQNSQTIPLVNCLLTDTGSGNQLMNQAVPVSQIFGNGQFPYILPEPYLLDARSNLSVQVTNRDAAQAYNLFLSFEGVKLYAYNG